MGLELLSKVFPFKVRHKPGYRMRVRVGIDSGPCTAGIIGDKLPHYSVFGETVEIAGVMEASSEPMKIQVCTNIHCALGYLFDLLFHNRSPSRRRSSWCATGAST